MYAQVISTGNGGIYIPQQILVSPSRVALFSTHPSIVNAAPTTAVPLSLSSVNPTTMSSSMVQAHQTSTVNMGGGGGQQRNMTTTPSGHHHQQQQQHNYHHHHHQQLAAAAAGDGPTQLRKLFIGGLNHETSDDQLRSFYSRWGTVVDCIVIRDPMTKHSRGFGFVTYATVAMAESAMAERPHTICGKIVDPKRAIPREEMSPLFASHPPAFLLEAEPDAQQRKIKLSGVHWDYHTVDTLRQYFDRYGDVSQVEILGHPRGLGFVVFDDVAAVERCLATKQHTINGRKCDVSKGEKSPPAEDSTKNAVCGTAAGVDNYRQRSSARAKAGGGAQC